MSESFIVSPPLRLRWLGSVYATRFSERSPTEQWRSREGLLAGDVGQLLTLGVSYRVRADLRRGTPVRPSRSALGGKTPCTHDTACSVSSSPSPHSARRSSRQRSSPKRRRQSAAARCASRMV